MVTIPTNRRSPTRASLLATGLALGLAAIDLFALLAGSPAKDATDGSADFVLASPDGLSDRRTIIEKASLPNGGPAGTSFGAQERLAEGTGIYTRYCVVCHQLNGKGLPGIFPPLAKSDYLLAHPERAIRGLIRGQSGQMIVNGKRYDGLMPPVPLNDEQIASVLSYVLNAWGNSHSPISAAQVEQVRSKMAADGTNLAKAR